MTRPAFSHFVGLWLRQGLPADLPVRLAQPERQTLLKAADAWVQGFGPSPWPAEQAAGDASAWQCVVGEPVLVERDVVQPRSRLLERLQAEPDEATLRDCQGSFCGLRWRAGAGIQLFSDALGLRPIFWKRWRGGIAFSTQLSALRSLLQQLQEHPAVDAQGIAETLAFAIGIGRRTCWQGIERLRHGEVVEGRQEGGVGTRPYRRFNTELDESLDLDSATAALDAALRRAVSDRQKLLPKLGRPMAFLSGGMDSRLVVALLAASGGEPPLTLNVAPAGSQDAVLGNEVAQLLGTDHRYRPTSSTLLGGIQASVAELNRDAQGAGLWWSGDGGSVCLGHVYLKEGTSTEAPSDARALASALAEDNRWTFSGAGLKPHVRANWLQQPIESIRAELRVLEDEGWPLQKRALGFLLFNDQQRHLDKHFESLDRQAFDLVLPFFDARFVAQVLRTPTRFLLRHRLYNHWFASRLGAAGRSPWQSYPGHEPCPHPVPEGLRPQWTGWFDAAHARRERHAAAKAMLDLAWQGHSPTPVSRLRLLLAGLLTGLGIRNLDYVLREVQLVCAAYALPEPPHSGS